MPNTTYGAAPINLSATATSGLPVSFSASGPCQVSSTTLTLTGAGLCTVTASQAGNAIYSAATDVQQAFTIAKAALSITTNDARTVYGAPLPTLTGSLTGVTNGDSITATYSTTAMNSARFTRILILLPFFLLMGNLPSLHGASPWSRFYNLPKI